jgi:hypothetical protein
LAGITRLQKLRKAEKLKRAGLETHGEADDCGFAGGVGYGGYIGCGIEGRERGVVSSVLEGCGEIADGEILFVVGSG